MSRTITISINDSPVEVNRGTTVAVALMHVGAGRMAINGERREALCGMGICWECRARVDGVADVRTCLIPVEKGMQVETHD
jgi:predicted molibdopterin-dependent oxidoreductase YjgC